MGIKAINWQKTAKQSKHCFIIFWAEGMASFANFGTRIGSEGGGVGQAQVQSGAGLAPELHELLCDLFWMRD